MKTRRPNPARRASRGGRQPTALAAAAAAASATVALVVVTTAVRIRPRPPVRPRRRRGPPPRARRRRAAAACQPRGGAATAARGGHGGTAGRPAPPRAWLGWAGRRGVRQRRRRGRGCTGWPGLAAAPPHTRPVGPPRAAGPPRQVPHTGAAGDGGGEAARPRLTWRHVGGGRPAAEAAGACRPPTNLHRVWIERGHRGRPRFSPSAHPPRVLLCFFFLLLRRLVGED